MQYYFAMVDESDASFTNAMKREDLEVYDFNFAHSEGDFATLDLTIKNPRVGLLNPSRHQWLWFAVEHPTAGTVPLFFGRIVGFPEDLDEDYVKVQYLAKSSDFVTLKTALAQSMCAAPWWDPIWFDSTAAFDPDNVLEFRSAMWHIDPVTHAVTFSDIIIGEDGNIALGESDVFYDSLKVKYGSRPLTSVSMEATVSWDQKAKGTLDITSRLLQNGNIIETYTGEGLSSGWPAAGKSFGGGWSVNYSNCSPVDYSSPYTVFETGYAYPSQQRTNWTPYEYFTFDAATFSPHGGLLLIKTNLKCQLTLGYDVSRRYSEKLAFTLYADIQPVVADIVSSSSETENVKMSSSELNQLIDNGGTTMPLSDERASTFFGTDRGDLALQSLLAIARAKLLARARYVEIEIEIPPLDAIALGISLRKNIILTDHRLPGALATGKITDFSFKLSGDDGDPTFAITFKCAIGLGGSVSQVIGEPSYAETDYVEDNYQVFDGSWVLPDIGDVVYQPVNGQVANDDGMNFFRMSAAKVVTSSAVHNPASVQAAQFPFHGGDTDSANPGTNFPAGTWSQYYLTQAAIAFMAGYNNASYRPEYEPANAIKALNDMKTTVELHLKDISSGPFETDYAVPTSALTIPSLIDLEAASAP